MKTKPFIQALKISSIYLIVGLIYIYFSDLLVNSFINDNELLTSIQNYKGFGFVIITALLLLLILLKLFKNIETEFDYHKKAKLKSTEMEERFRLLFENSGEAILLTRPDGSIEAANPEACRIFGRTEEEIYNDGRNGLVDLSDERVKEALDERSRAGKFKGELNFIRKDGTIFPAELSSNLFKDSKGHLLSSMFIKDITERKLAEEIIKKEKSLLDAIINNIPVMITRYDPYNNLLLLNKETEKLLGYTTEETSKINLMEKVYPDPNYRKQVAEYMAKAVVEWREFQCRSKSGEIIDSQWSNIKLADGTLIGIGFDIRERNKSEKELVESEQKYRILFENNPHPMWVYDLQTLNFLAVNQAAINKYGYTRDEFLSMTLQSIRPEEDIEGLLKNINQHKELIQESGVWRHKLKDGTMIHVEIVSHGLVYENKSARLVMANDVTKRIAAETQLKLKSENLSKLLEISLELNKSYNKNDVLQKIVDSSVDLIGLDSGAIYLINGGELIMAATYPMLPPDFSEEYRKAKIKDHPHIEKAVNSKRVFILQDTLKEKLTEKERIIVNSSGFRSLIYLPLISDDNVIGVLILGTKSRLYDYTDAVINLCLTLSNLSALALTNSILFDKLNRNVIELNQVIDEKTIATLALAESEERFHSMFKKHHAVMLLIDVESVKIIDANDSAVNYYGYSADEIKSMRIDQINILDPDKIAAEIKKAAYESRTYFNFPHRLKYGEVRNVEVYTSPIILKGETVLFSIIHDITERRKAEEEVLKSREILRALTARLEQIKEEERINLSRELHDNLGQSLTALKMDTAWIDRKIRDLKVKSIDAFIEKAKSMSFLIDDIINNVRRISSELRPNTLDYLGLIPSLEWLGQDFQKRTEIFSSFSCEISDIPINKNIATSTFRIFQEAFTNVTRHADATKVELRIDQTDDNFRIQLSDNGRGISPEKISNTKSLGIIGMQERTLQFGGELIISSIKPKGTQVTLYIPKENKND